VKLPLFAAGPAGALMGVAFGYVVAAPPPKAIVVSQPESPVQVTEYRPYSAADGIRHLLKFTNRHSQDVIAIRFGLLEFDAFDRFSTGIDADPKGDLRSGESAHGMWVSSPYARTANFATGLVYVETVRMADGTSWQADESRILAEVRKIDENFDAADLKRGGGTR